MGSAALGGLLIDIDDIRKVHIKMHSLSRADKTYTFYHDETNNVRKYCLGPDGFNVADPGVFVLGGMVHKGMPYPLNIEPLRNAMRVQKSAVEIKLKHVTKGEFPDLLRSKKLTIFLRWITDTGLVVHYHALDPVYWSVVDIIDSILAGLGQFQLLQFQARLKADLLTVLRANLRATSDLFYHYDYPNVAPESLKPLLNDLLRLLDSSHSILRPFDAMLLKGILQSGRDLPTLEFIQGFKHHMLIENFAAFYLTRIAVFKYSNHILDMEDSIRDELETIEPFSDGEPVQNYRFTDSMAEVGIQLSDVIVGLIGKMFTYLTATPSNEVMAERSSLAGDSLTNAMLLSSLIDKSHKENIAFLHHVLSVDDIDKMNAFLRISGSAYGD